MSFTVGRAGIERLDALAPLWIAMQAHHESVAPRALIDEVAPFRPPSDSWMRRRASYASWFDAGNAVLYVAEDDDDGGLAGYAMVRLSDGWSQLATPETMAELESLSVAADHRGRAAVRPPRHAAGSHAHDGACAAGRVRTVRGRRRAGVIRVRW